MSQASVIEPEKPVEESRASVMLRNTALLAVSEILKPCISFLLIVYISRRLGVGGMGAFALIVAFVHVFEIVATAGLAPVIVRGVATDHNAAPFYLKGGVAIGLAASALCQAILWVGVSLMNYSPDVADGIRLLGWTLTFMVLTQFIQAIFEGYQQMGYRSALGLFETAGRTMGGVLAVHLGLGLPGIIQSFVIVRAAMMILAIVLVARQVPLSFDFSLEWRRYVGLVSEAAPFLATAIVSSLYWHVDILMLSRLGTIEEVGTYNAAYRLMAILNGLTYTYLIALLPLVAASFARSLETFRRDCEMSIKYLVVITLPAAAGMTVLSDQIIELVYGADFSESSLVLQILIWTICFFSVALVFARALVASHNQRLDLYCNLAGLGANACLNLFLIPRFGALGAATATLGSILFFLAIQHFAVARTLFRVSLWSHFSKPALASLALAMVAFWLRETYLFVVIPISALVYAGALYLLRAFSQQELTMFRSALQTSLARYNPQLWKSRAPDIKD